MGQAHGTSVTGLLMLPESEAKGRALIPHPSHHLRLFLPQSTSENTVDFQKQPASCQAAHVAQESPIQPRP